MNTLRYNFHTIQDGRKQKSTQILSEMIEHAETCQEVYIKKFKSLIVDKYACIRGKTGIVRKITAIGNRILIWLEIKLTRGVVVHYGIEL